LEAQGDLADKPREKKTLVKEWTKGWLTPTIVATVFLAAAAFGTLVFWPPGLLSGKRLEITAKGADSARQAAEAQAANAEKARQAAEARAADAEKARQAAEGKAVDAEKARQTAQAQTANAEKIRRAAEAELQSAETARQAAEAKIADAEKAQRAAEAKAAQIFSRPTTNMWIEGSSTISADSVGECEQLCARNQTCKAYSYNRSDGMCLHSYRSETHMAPKSGWICAVRIN
jgi:flagellar biosynthesis GTPase FlhF